MRMLEAMCGMQATQPAGLQRTALVQINELWGDGRDPPGLSVTKPQVFHHQETLEVTNVPGANAPVVETLFALGLQIDSHSPCSEYYGEGIAK